MKADNYTIAITVTWFAQVWSSMLFLYKSVAAMHTILVGGANDYTIFLEYLVLLGSCLYLSQKTRQSR